MNWQGWAEIALTLFTAIALGWPLGVYMSRVWNGERTWLDPVLKPVERLVYAASGVDPAKSQTWSDFTSRAGGWSACLTPSRPRGGAGLSLP